MSTMPWGTMNGWIRMETEQRGVWRQQRVQDLRAADVAGRARPAPVRPAVAPAPQPRPALSRPGCPEAA